MKFFSLIYQGDLHPASDEKVVASTDFTKLLSAIEVLETAKEDAQKLLEETQKECEILKEKAKHQGLQEGLQKFNEQILYMDTELKKIRHELQRMVLPLALTAAKKIVSKELELFPETIVDIVLQALIPIRQSHQVTILVNKQDKDALEKKKSKLRDLLDQVTILTILEKNDISPGGCIIQTESGLINATIENQWKALEKAFEKYFKRAK